MFSKWLRDNGFDPNNMPSYLHTYEDGRAVNARAYPNSHLQDFRAHFTHTWMRERAIKYFGERDPQSITYLEQLLALPNYTQVVGMIEAQSGED